MTLATAPRAGLKALTATHPQLQRIERRTLRQTPKIPKILAVAKRCEPGRLAVRPRS